MDAAVIVAGAGPAGLMLAGELRLAGVDVIVLERTAERSGESRGVGLTTRTVEVFDQRGLLSKFGPLETGKFGHFAGLFLDLGVLDSAHEPAKTVPQSHTETVLEKWAFELGADVRRGTEVVGLRQEDGHVEVTARGARGTEELTCEYLVGCDGGRSAVRRLAGFEFPGTPATRELLLADVRGIDVRPRMIGEQVPGGMVMAAKLPGGVTRLIASEHGKAPRPRDEPVSYGELADLWLRLAGDDVSAGECVWLSAFGDAARQAARYRRGRVLLAGDAAHVHLAAGGQGMNTGIQDSVNLGWKLAARVRGHARDELLDSYHDERHPVGERLLVSTRAQGHLILSGPEIVPLRRMLAELTAVPEAARHLAGLVSGLDIRYDVGAGSHPLLGLRVPHWELATAAGPVTTTALLRPARGLLLDLRDNPVLRARAAAWADRIDVVTGTPAGETAGDTTAVLVRPDGHVAWAAPGSHHDLTTALDRWFGPARTP
ncbi:FAD-dependent monooxygenase [Amycolatopsis sp. NPDC098790]|uniref:FAD-dependent monooxygenase n=1 Tax=Amycolatopsis sp. NPDC098790 TaxID=3363939 RepID=UPI003801E9FF